MSNPNKQIPGGRGGTITPWTPGESGNPSGRPPSIHVQVVQALEDDGYERVTKAMVAQMYEILLGLSEVKLKELAKAEDVPVAIKIVAKALTGRRAFDVLEAMLDRAHGKPKQTLAGDQDNPLWNEPIQVFVGPAEVEPITSEQQIIAMLKMEPDDE